MSGPHPVFQPPPDYQPPPDFQPPPGGYGQFGFAPPPPPPPRKNPAIMAVFVGVMLGVAVLAAIVILASQPAPPTPPCEPGQACAPQPSLPVAGQVTPKPSGSMPSGDPTIPPPTLAPGATATPFAVPSASPESNAPPLLSGRLWQSATLSYAFEYDSDAFTLTDTSDDLAVFSATFVDAQVVVHAVPASVSPADLIAQELAVVDTFMIGRVRDSDSYDALLGPSIGYVRGTGDVFSGTMLGSDGTPVAPGGVTVLAATDGRLTVIVVVVVNSPDERHGSDTQQHVARGLADLFLKTFDWDAR